MNQRWRAEDAIRADWWKDSQTASSLIFFVIDTASRFAFGLQQERVGYHVHRASWCQNLILKSLQMSILFPLIAPLSLPLLSASSVSPCFLLVLHSMPPTLHFKNRNMHSRHYSMWKPVFIGRDIDDFSTFHLSSWLESHLNKSSVFSQKTTKQSLQLPCLDYDAEKP